MFCTKQNPERAFKLDNAVRETFLEQLQADVAFLRHHSLIDYSLLVGINFSAAAAVGGGGGGGGGEERLPSPKGKGLAARGGVGEVYYIELIDYLIK